MCGWVPRDWRSSWLSSSRTHTFVLAWYRARSALVPASARCSHTHAGTFANGPGPSRLLPQEMRRFRALGRGTELTWCACEGTEDIAQRYKRLYVPTTARRSDTTTRCNPKFVDFKHSIARTDGEGHSTPSEHTRRRVAQHASQYPPAYTPQPPYPLPLPPVAWLPSPLDQTNRLHNTRPTISQTLIFVIFEIVRGRFVRRGGHADPPRRGGEKRREGGGAKECSTVDACVKVETST